MTGSRSVPRGWAEWPMGWVLVIPYLSVWGDEPVMTFRWMTLVGRWSEMVWVVD